MKNFILFIGGIFGALSIIFGAFGAHALKKILTDEKLTSFETGVRYQMYGAFFLVIIGFFLNFETTVEKWSAWCMIFGILLFSGSIYLLCFQEIWRINLKFLGPITPLGGLLMIISWGLFVFFFGKKMIY